MNKDDNLLLTRKLVGDITAEQLQHVDLYPIPNFGIFIPSTGPCFYSITPDHYHPSYLFTFSPEGNMKIAVKDKITVTEPHKISAISPFIKHSEILETNFKRYYAICVAKIYFEEILSEYCITPMTFYGENYNINHNLTEYIKDFLIEYDNELPGHKDILSGTALKITHAIIRSIFNISRITKAISLKKEINQIVEYLNNNYGEDLSIDDLALKINYSPSHFSRVFKEETGESPQIYLINLRLQKAKHLLLIRGKTITEIALECGFNSSSHFCVSFLRKYDKTPTDFRKLYLS